MFHNNIAKISEKLNKGNLLKICLQVIPTVLCEILGKNENIWCFKNQFVHNSRAERKTGVSQMVVFPQT